MTQRDGMGRKVGGVFRMGNMCTPVVDACWCMANPIQNCKVKKIIIKKNITIKKIKTLKKRKKIFLQLYCIKTTAKLTDLKTVIIYSLFYICKSTGQLEIGWSRLGSSGLSSKLQVELRFTRYISNPSWTKRPPGASSSHGNGTNARGISRSMQWLLKTIFENCVMALILDKANHMAKANKNGQGNILCFESEELQSPMAKNINVGK